MPSRIAGWAGCRFKGITQPPQTQRRRVKGSLDSHQDVVVDFYPVLPHRCTEACYVPGCPVLMAALARLGVKPGLGESRGVVPSETDVAQFLLWVRDDQALPCLCGNCRMRRAPAGP